MGETVERSIVVDLDYPITVAGVRRDSLTLRRPKMADVVAVQKAAPAGPAEAELMMLAQLAGLSPEAVGMVDVADYNKIRAALNSASG